MLVPCCRGLHSALVGSCACASVCTVFGSVMVCCADVVVVAPVVLIGVQLGEAVIDVMYALFVAFVLEGLCVAMWQLPSGLPCPVACCVCCVHGVCRFRCVLGVWVHTVRCLSWHLCVGCFRLQHAIVFRVCGGCRVLFVFYSCMCVFSLFAL